jgi:hypothetical protein
MINTGFGATHGFRHQLGSCNLSSVDEARVLFGEKCIPVFARSLIVLSYCYCFSVGFEEVFIEIAVLCQIVLCRYFLSFCNLPFYLLNRVF